MMPFNLTKVSPATVAMPNKRRLEKNLELTNSRKDGKRSLGRNSETKRGRRKYPGGGGCTKDSAPVGRCAPCIIISLLVQGDYERADVSWEVKNRSTGNREEPQEGSR